MKLPLKYWKYMRQFAILGGMLLTLIKVWMAIVELGQML
jgi:hypothetical protein